MGVNNHPNLATYDFNHLTRLVVMAHDRCIRVELIPKGMNRFLISLHKRERDGGISQRHPQLEEAVDFIRSKDSTFLNQTKLSIAVNAISLLKRIKEVLQGDEIKYNLPPDIVLGIINVLENSKIKP